MKYQISELIDLAALQGLMESLHRATGINHALIDNESVVLTAVGWEPVCTDFHRVNPATCQRCLESDRYILSQIQTDSYVGYDCPNGLVDYATPVIIDGEHMANVFTGQMFHSPPDLARFRRQATEFGFAMEPYMAAVRQVQIIPRERMPDIMAFLVGLAQMLGQQGLTRLRQLDAEKELRQFNAELAERVRMQTEEISEKNLRLSHKIAKLESTEVALRHEKQFSDDIINGLPGVFYMLDQRAGFARWNHKLCEVSGYSQKEVACMMAQNFFASDTHPLIQEQITEVFERGETSIEASLLTKDGRRIPYFFSGRKTHIGEQSYLVGLGIDITTRKALENELEKQAHEDELTGMASRRYFLERAEQELVRSRRYGSPLSFLVLDIDKFKEINDRHGHGIGDRVLRQLAESCRKTLRSVDIAGRIGGDEFAVILPETDAGQALEVAQRLGLAIDELVIPSYDGNLIPCTASIGVTTLNNADDGIDTLLRQADEALYRAKKTGRNRVLVFQLPTN